MSLYTCPAHGEVLIYPYASRDLVNKLESVTLDLAEIQTVLVEFYDDDELIQSNNYYFLKQEIPEGLTHLVIRNEQDESSLLGNLIPKFKGGGVCPKCFEEYLVRQKL